MSTENEVKTVLLYDFSTMNEIFYCPFCCICNVQIKDVLTSFGLNFISLFKYIIAKLHALKTNSCKFYAKGFRRKSIDGIPLDEYAPKGNCDV